VPSPLHTDVKEALEAETEALIKKTEESEVSASWSKAFLLTYKQYFHI